MLVSKAWSAWWLHRCKMARVRQMAVKLCYRSVWVAFDTWADTVAYEKEEARRSADRAMLQADVQRAEELHHYQILKAAVWRMMKRGLSMCFTSWLCWAREKAAVRTVLRKIILRLQNMRVSSAFGSWQSWISREQQTRLLCGRAVQRMQGHACE